MRLVQHAALPPHRCGAIPYLGNSSARRGFIDTGQDIIGRDPHLYVSVEAVEHMARMVGWQPAYVLESVKGQAAKKDQRIGELEADLAEARAQLDAVKVLKNTGFVQRNAPGRPRKAATDAPAEIMA